MPMYSDLVEFYDSKNDDISFYFSEKIQSVLVLQKSLNLIYKKQQKDSKRKNSFHHNMNNSSSMNVDESFDAYLFVEKDDEE